MNAPTSAAEWFLIDDRYATVGRKVHVAVGGELRRVRVLDTGAIVTPGTSVANDALVDEATIGRYMNRRYVLAEDV